MGLFLINKRPFSNRAGNQGLELAQRALCLSKAARYSQAAISFYLKEELAPLALERGN